MSRISMEPKLEKKLITAARKNKDDFAPLYEHYHRHILDFFQYRVSEKHIAEELTSSTFEKVLNGIDNYQWQGVPFSAWLFRIARNTLIDHYRKSKKDNKMQQLDEEFKPLLEKQTPDTLYETNLSENILYRVINELPLRERDIIYMKFFDGYTNRVIANLTGLTETNIGTIVYRTLRKMRELYLSQGQPDQK